ncbi:MAG: hypothetical protein WC067_03940 [Candidatus Methanomethylophilaceae archaeon]
MDENMSVEISVKNTANGDSVRMRVDSNERVSEIIDSAAEYWKKDAGTYVLKKGKTLLCGSDTAAEINLMNDDILELLPDPEGGLR